MPKLPTLANVVILQIALALAVIGGAEWLVQASRPTSPAAGKASGGGPSQAATVAPVAAIDAPFLLK